MPLSVSGAPITDLADRRPAADRDCRPRPLRGRAAERRRRRGHRLRVVHGGGDARRGAGPGRCRRPLHAAGAGWLVAVAAWAPSGWMVKRLEFRGRAHRSRRSGGDHRRAGRQLDVLLTSQLTVVTGTASDSEGAPLLDFHAVVFPAEEKGWRLGSPARVVSAPTPTADSASRGCSRATTSSPSSSTSIPRGARRRAACGAPAWATRVRVREGQTETVALKLAPLP